MPLNDNQKSRTRQLKMPKLYPEDQEKVNQYIQKEGGGDEREPFKPFKLLLVILAALGALTLASFWVAAQHGYV